MKAVLDTNVVGSGLLTHHGTCAEIIDRMRMEMFKLCSSHRILREYAEVLFLICRFHRAQQATCWSL